MGIRTLGNAGFDPHGAARFLETMQAYQTLSSGRSDALSDGAFMSSHPSTPQRVDLARRMQGSLVHRVFCAADRDRYLSGIDGLLFGDSAEEGFVGATVFPIRVWA